MRYSGSLSRIEAPRKEARAAIIAVSTLACVSGALAAAPSVEPALIIGLVLATALVVAVARHPPLAAYILLGATPLIAGIDRGAVVPILRPNELLALVLGAGLVFGSVVRTGRLALTIPRLTVTERAIVMMAIAGSALPLAWMRLRGIPITSDDLQYALLIWKFLGVYAIVRASIRTPRAAGVCLRITLVAGCVVACIAILQALQLFGVPRLLSTYFAPYGNVQAVSLNRGGATLGLPIAVADLMVFEIAIAVGLIVRGIGRRALLVLAALLLAIAAIAAGEISGIIALLIGAIALAVITRRASIVAWGFPVAAVAVVALGTVVERRLAGFDGASGIPVGWVGRIHNLTGYFWPELFSGGRFVLGVRSAARVPAPDQATGFVWIESGYTWLLWSGGIVFLLTFIWFVSVTIRWTVRLARHRLDEVGVAALVVTVALIVIAALMVVDPHLTYRGSADLFFSMAALASIRTVHREATWST